MLKARCYCSFLRIHRGTSIFRQQQRLLSTSKSDSASSESPSLMSQQELPSSADVVIIGGGVIGCSVQYHLASIGITDTVLLEKHKLTAGTTWHTAGLVWNLRPNDTEIELLQKSKKLMTRIEDETGINPGWINNGGLFIASTDTRLDEYKRLMTIGRAYEIESFILTPEETKKLYPLMNVSDISGSLYSPGDGTIEPSGYCAAMSRYSTNKGAKVLTETFVCDTFTRKDDFGQTLVTGVRTNSGDIKAPIVVNCAGVWSPELGKQINVNVPLLAMKHAYVNTEPIPGIRGMPNIRDHDASVYLKVDGDALSVGGYEVNPDFWPKVEKDFAFSLFDLDWDVFSSNIAGAINRVPAVETSGIKTTICGPESFTPDHKPLMGESPEVRGYFLGCGFNSSGMMLSGGCGEQLAIWIRDGRPDLDMFAYDIRRFPHSITNNSDWLKTRSHEAYAKNYSIVFPHDEPLASRNVNKGVLHKTLLERGCVYQDRHCFERPGWFSLMDANDCKPRTYDYYGQYGNAKHIDHHYAELLKRDYIFDFPEHHDVIGKECLACRNEAAIFDMSYFGKYYLSGKDAQLAVDWLFSNDLHKPQGTIVYTCMLNAKGGVEADLTVSVMQPSKGFYIAAGGGIRQHTYTHIKQVIADKRFDCEFTDVSDQLSIISVQGPKSQQILQKLTEVDLSEEMFPYNTHTEVKLGGATVNLFRVSFVGEHGYEVHVDNGDAVDVYEAITKVGMPLGLVNSGYRAMDSLSAEKGYRHWHADVRSDDSPLDCGLSFTCRKQGEYLGSKVIAERRRQGGATRRLACFTLDNKVALHGLETIYRDGKVAGHIRRADYAHYLGKTIAYGYVKTEDGSTITADYLKRGSYSIEVMGCSEPAVFHIKTPFDPKGLRTKAIY